MRRSVWILGLVALAAMAAAAPEQHPEGITAQRLGDAEWKPGPFPGSQVALVAGDPARGMHHGYLKLADGAFIGPHWHSTDEIVTVISGSVVVGTGEKADRGATRLYGPGALLVIPAEVPHYAWAKGDAVVSQTRSGAADVHWVNPEDDPAASKPAPEK